MTSCSSYIDLINPLSPNDLFLYFLKASKALNIAPFIIVDLVQVLSGWVVTILVL